MAKIVVYAVVGLVGLLAAGGLTAYYKKTPSSTEHMYKEELEGHSENFEKHNGEIYFPCSTKECNRDRKTVNARPNFIVLFADDFGWGDLGANWIAPGSSSDTIYLDKLARKGIRFTDFHAGASLCTPSRATLLTSRLGLRTGVVKNFDVKAKGGLPLNETTFAETFKAAGYRTGMIGKVYPNSRGFDYYYGLPYSNDMGCLDRIGYSIPHCVSCPKKQQSFVPPTYPSIKPRVNNHGSHHPDLNACYYQYLAVPLYENKVILEQPTDIKFLAKKYAEKARNFILKSQEDRTPFLLYVAFTHTHVPHEYDDKFKNTSLNGVFGDTVRELDATVEAIYSVVEEAGIENNTMLWFTGDNGPARSQCEFGGKEGPFLGQWQKLKGGGGSTGKVTTWEGGHREPALAYWPGHIQPGQVSHSLLSAIDIFPTMAAIANIPMPPNRRFDGIDVSPVLFNSTHIYDRVLFHPDSGAGHGYGGLNTVRIGRFKAMYKTGGVADCNETEDPVKGHNPPLIFNLLADPGERDAMDQMSSEYQDALILVQKALKNIETDLNSDNTTVADYSEDEAAMPCCNPQNIVCRCNETNTH